MMTILALIGWWLIIWSFCKAYWLYHDFNRYMDEEGKK